MGEQGEIDGRAARERRAGYRGRSDRDLLRAARAGSDDAVTALVERHWDDAHRIAYGILGDSHSAEDVAQEALVSILANLGRFDTRRPFVPWLHRIVANRAIDWSRARSRREEAVRSVEPPPADEGPDPRLTEALARLSPEHRAVVVLRYIGGYGPDEIASLLGIRRGTVGSRLRRALDQLRGELEEDDG